MTISTTTPQRSNSAPETHHRFAVGQTVRLTGGFRTSDGVYVITARLPPVDGSPQYRIRSEAESFERMATQANLELVSAPVRDATKFP